MPLCNSLQAAACVFLCAAGLTSAQSLNRPAPIASPMETTVVDGGLGAAPAIELPRVESAPASNGAADFARPFAQTTTANHPSNGLAAKLLKIGLGGMIPVPGLLPEAKNNDLPPSGNAKLGFKRFLMHKTAVEVSEPGQ